MESRKRAIEEVDDIDVDAPVTQTSGKDFASFETFYKVQNIVPANEWDDFVRTLWKPLPVTFRLTKQVSNKEHMDSLKTYVDTNFVNVAPEKSILRKLDWLDEEQSNNYQLSSALKEISDNSNKQSLLKFIKTASEAGYVSVQEATTLLPTHLLNVDSHHNVLNVCAERATHTEQLVELMTKYEPSRETGILIANDKDTERCEAFAGQTKRPRCPSLVVTKSDPAVFPSLTTDSNGNCLKFDRILCEVPSTKDGAIRSEVSKQKEGFYFLKWCIADGLRQHSQQIRILRRSLELLAMDGLLVYAVQSLNPLECEAVVGSFLERSANELELVDVSSQLKNVKYVAGLQHWTVMSSSLNKLDNHSTLSGQDKREIASTMFPPQNASELLLNRCVRILPHHQNTNGLFVAVIRKKCETVSWENSMDIDSGNMHSEDIELDRRPKKRMRTIEPTPYKFYQLNIKEWRGTKKNYMFNNELIKRLVHREIGKNQHFLCMLAPKTQELITHNGDGENLTIVAAGVNVFERDNDLDAQCGFKPNQDSLKFVLPFVEPTKVFTQVPTRNDFEKLMNAVGPLNYDCFSKELRSLCVELSPGRCPHIFVFTDRADQISDNPLSVAFCVQRISHTTNVFADISISERIHFLRLFGCKIGKLGKSKMSQSPIRN